MVLYMRKRSAAVAVQDIVLRMVKGQQQWGWENWCCACAKGTPSFPPNHIVLVHDLPQGKGPAAVAVRDMVLRMRKENPGLIPPPSSAQGLAGAASVMLQWMTRHVT
eukprot:1142802-Pelagomonas_calceolata.AAC.2